MISVRNYLFSLAVHLLLLLLLLSWTLLAPDQEPKPEQHVILVDFSNVDQPKSKVSVSKERTSSATEQSEPNISSTSKKAPVEQAKIVKVVEKNNLHKSQKPKPRAESSSQPLQEEATIVKKVIPPKEKVPSKEEIEYQKQQEIKSKKKSEFASLLSKAKDYAATSDDQPNVNDNDTDNEKQDGSTTISQSNKNIRGVLGNRKVLRTPVIRDNSQKKGKVVVKICVNSEGKVISSKYTMMGSTTNDSYLIQLAEKGAMDYLFSQSDNPKECGNVIIDFQLK